MADLFKVICYRLAPAGVETLRLVRLSIDNFRSLNGISVDFDKSVNVIVGPNATGKTTVLIAIRLAKALLAPRTQNEGMQALMQLGAIATHLNNQLIPSALTRDPTRPIRVNCTYAVSTQEVENVVALETQLISRIAQQSLGQNFLDPIQLATFLASPLGIQAKGQATQTLRAELDRLKSDRKISLNLTIDFQQGGISGEYPLQQLVMTVLDGLNSPERTLFSYFPAERALPHGDQQVQMGVAETQQQLESHNSQPSLKYQRLKQSIFTTIVRNKEGRQVLEAQFESIFKRILRGRTLGEAGINAIGMLSIPIGDENETRFFDIDGLSSGEKGLILLCLNMQQSVAEHGIALLDEPDLHLNTTVCKDLFDVLISDFALAKGIQLFICSHSSEILGGALNHPSSALYHLRQNGTLVLVREQDQGEIRDALARLGSSRSEALLYQGTLSVEGPHDAEILRASFGSLLRRTLIKQLGGRANIEADIEALQKAEERGDDVGRQLFLFDLDRSITALKSKGSVKVEQLSRYCIENYLLDPDVLTEISRDEGFAINGQKSVSDMYTHLKQAAFSQISELAARSAFQALGLERVRFDMAFARIEDSAFAGYNLQQQIDGIRSLLPNEQTFQAQFCAEHRRKYDEIRSLWETDWIKQANGKKVFEDLRRLGIFKGDILKLKKKVAAEIRVNETQSWHDLKNHLVSLVPL